MLLLVVRLSGVMEGLFYQPTVGQTPAPTQFPGAEHVTFPSGDGETLVGWFLPASDAAPAEAPTILHIHGNAGNLIDHIGFSSHFAENGFNLFIFDYRGYGESTGSARRRASLLRDAHAALDYLLARSDIAPDRIGVFGQSLGGALAINLMAERGEIAAGLIVSAFTSWRDIAADVVGLGPLGRFFAWVLLEDHLRVDEAMRKIARPVQLVHGTADEIIPVHHSRQLNDASPVASLVELEGGDHNGLRLSHPEFDTITVEFFAQHLQTPDNQ